MLILLKTSAMASSSVTLARALAQSLGAAAASGGAHASPSTLAVSPAAAAAPPVRGVLCSSFSSSSSSSFFGGSSSFARTTVPCRQTIGAPVRSNGGGGRGSHVVASANGTGAPLGLAIDLRGKTAFIAGVADDQGFGWGIAKALAAAGATILVGTWVPALNIFETSLRRGKFDESRKLPNGSMFEIAKVYPLDAVFDTLEDVPEDIKNNKRYAGSSKWTVKEVVETVEADYGKVDILVHSLANGPEVTKALLDTSRKGYLAAISASSYSYVSLLKYFAPIMNPGGAAISLTYLAGERAIPGYGGGMSSAKAALDSDTKVLAFEAGRKYNIRVNTISAGPLRSRAAKAIGFIDDMINYSTANAPLQKELESDDVGAVAAFLSSPLASAVTGTVVYVDNGLHCMGLAPDSPTISKAAGGSPATKSSVPA